MTDFLRQQRAAIASVRYELLLLDRQSRQHWVNERGSIADDAPGCAERIIGGLVDAGTALDECLKLLDREAKHG